MPTSTTVNTLLQVSTLHQLSSFASESHSQLSAGLSECRGCRLASLSHQVFFTFIQIATNILCVCVCIFLTIGLRRRSSCSVGEAILIWRGRTRGCVLFEGDNRTRFLILLFVSSSGSRFGKQTIGEGSSCWRVLNSREGNETFPATHFIVLIN